MDGDGNPLDLIDVSDMGKRAPLALSDYLVLGVLGVIDNGQLDYKILAIEVNESRERGIKCLRTYREKCPDQLESIIDWYKKQECADGTPRNKFLWQGEVQGANLALELISECHFQYRTLFEEPESDGENNYWISDNSRMSIA